MSHCWGVGDSNEKVVDAVFAFYLDVDVFEVYDVFVDAVGFFEGVSKSVCVEGVYFCRFFTGQLSFYARLLDMALWKI